MPSSRRPSASTMSKDGGQDINEDDSEHGGSAAGDDKDDAKRSSQARKAQNRVAQREFRIRRQQYIRDLEARVEVLSSDKEEKTELTMLLIKNLLKENKDLRMLLKTMAGFIGEGLGSCLPRLGLSSAGLDAILNRADTDTAYEAFINLKASKELAEANPGIELGEIRRGTTSKRKRGSVDPIRGAGTTEPELPHRGSGTPEIHSGPSTGPGTSQPINDPKRVKSEFNDALQMGANDYSYDYLFPNLDQLAAHPVRQGGMDSWGNYLGAWHPSSYVSPRSFGDSMRGGFPFNPGYPMPPQDAFAGANMSGFGVTIPGTTYGPMPPPPPGLDLPVEMVNSGSGGSGSTGHIGPGPGPGPGQGQPDGRGEFSGPNWFMIKEQNAGTTADKTRVLKEAVQRMSASRQITTHGPLMSAEEVEERRRIQGEVLANMEDSNVMQCFQLITYHLNNFRGNHAYVLPPSLRPTVIQRTIPHEHVIDGCLFPTIRDRMILLRGRYDLVGAITGILVSWTQHGDDPLDHRNWEASESWLNEYNQLCDDEVYAIVNKWRKHRGAPVLPRPPPREA